MPAVIIKYQSHRRLAGLTGDRGTFSGQPGTGDDKESFLASAGAAGEIVV